jgi:hypothetical protein
LSEASDPVAPSVAAYTPDLMDRSKISAALPGCRFVATPEALVGLAGVGVVVVDLSKKGVLDALPAIVAGGARVLGYGSHVDHALLGAATAAGVDEVLPRSKFFARLAAGELP